MKIKLLLLVTLYFINSPLFSMVVFVETLSSKIISVTINSETPTVNDIMLGIQELESYLPEQQNLFFNGMQLKPQKKLEHYGIDNNATLHLITNVTTIWRGLFSEEWTFQANWSVNTPDLSSDVIIADVGKENSKSPIIDNMESCKNLIIEEGASLTISENGILSIYGNFKNEGKLNVEGEIKAIKDLKNIKNPNIAGLGAEITSQQNLGNVIITRGGQSHFINGKNSITRYYDIYPTNNKDLQAKFIFHYDDSELNGNNEKNLQLFISTDGGLNWKLWGGEVDTDKNTIQITNVNQFSLITAMSVKTKTFALLRYIISGFVGLILLVSIFLLKKRKSKEKGKTL